MPPWKSVSPTERSCERCGETFLAKHPLARFCSARCRDKGRTRQGYSSEQKAEWRRRRLTEPGYRERENRVAAERARRIKDWLDAFKLAAGCVDCGYRDHAVALDFDHIQGAKRRNVCQSKSIAQAKAEIALCEVRCSNCHRVMTAARRS